MPYLPGESSSQAIDRTLQKREALIDMMKFHLLRAQNRMKQYADSHRSDREFSFGDYVYLKLQPYRQHLLKGRNLPHKLSPRYYGPFRVPSTSMPPLPQYLNDIGSSREPELILEKKMVNWQNKPVTKILVQWKGSTPQQATWEFYQDFIAQYPEFQP
ncbi:hypothetical protein Bca4012_051551 [Brassica carinata]